MPSHLPSEEIAFKEERHCVLEIYLQRAELKGNEVTSSCFVLAVESRLAKKKKSLLRTWNTAKPVPFCSPFDPVKE